MRKLGRLELLLLFAALAALGGSSYAEEVALSDASEVSQVTVSGEPPCSTAFTDAETVSFLWYPRYPHSVSWTHTKLAVNNHVFFTMMRFSEKGSLEAFQRSAKINQRQEFYQFDIQVSAQERERLLNALQGDQRDRIRVFGLPGCVQGACAALNWKTSFKIPLPFNQMPTAAALYLTLLHYSGMSRVAKITYHGPNIPRWKRVVGPDLFFDLVTSLYIALSIKLMHG